MNDYQKQHYFCDVCNKFTPHVPVPQKEDLIPESHSPTKFLVFRIAAALLELFAKNPETGIGSSYSSQNEGLYMCEKCGETTLV